MNNLTQLLLNRPASEVEITMGLLNAVLLGTVLAFATYKMGDKGQSSLERAFNILLFTVGISGMAILINNNLTRAITLAATLSLLRFRVKVGNKGGSADWLFATLVGLAAGLGEVHLAWYTLGIYIGVCSLRVLFSKRKKINND